MFSSLARLLFPVASPLLAAGEARCAPQAPTVLRFLFGLVALCLLSASLAAPITVPLNGKCTRLIVTDADAPREAVAISSDSANDHRSTAATVECQPGLQLLLSAAAPLWGGTLENSFAGPVPEGKASATVAVPLPPPRSLT